MTATFADGTTHTADFAVGAEGSRSAVRKYLVGEALAQPLQPPVVMAMVRCHLPQAQIDQFFKLGERLWVSFHPEGGYLMMGGTLERPRRFPSPFPAFSASTLC